MPKDVKFNIKLIVDGKEQIVAASTNTKELARQSRDDGESSGVWRE